MAKIYLALGSNLGQREKNIKEAIQQLEANDIIIDKISKIIETDPVGGPTQNKFLNAVLEGQTTLSPFDLLTLSKDIEQKLGRTKTVVNGPRIIDIDILLYDKQKLSTPELTIPHPRMLQRNFVMIPLSEIDPKLTQELQHENH